MKLFIIQGLPGSGKSTLAHQMIAADPTWVRVNKDDIRAELEQRGCSECGGSGRIHSHNDHCYSCGGHGHWTWSPKNENEVKQIRDMRIRMALQRGNSVISDDCNFGKHPGHLAEIGRQEGAQVEHYVMQTPLDECIRRDAQRTGKACVGEEVIRKMWCRYLAPPPESYHFERVKETPGAPYCIMCDLDGTLALFDGLRSPYDAAKCADDNVNWPVQMIVQSLHRAYDRQIVFLSGRSAQYRKETVAFLKKAYFYPGTYELFMRPVGDNRKDWVVKGELFDTHVRPRYNVDFVLDDRNQVVDFWRSIGLQCWQVAPGDF